MKNIIYIIIAVLLVAESKVLVAQTSTKNYVQQQNIRIEGFNEQDLIDKNYNTYQVSESVSYYDGLQRVQHSVIKDFSPNLNDLVNITEYDDYGKISKARLPFCYTNTNYLDHSTAVGEQKDFYQETPKIANTTKPEFDIIYEDSPFSRPLISGAPGVAWQINNNQYSENIYRLNNFEEIEKYTFDAGTCTYSGYYSTSSLFVNISKDEDQKPVKVVKDALGKTIAVGNKVDATTMVYTYYIYDEAGMLRFVMSPEGMSQVSGSFGITDAVALKYAYYYEYDDKRRLIEKRLPGKDPIYYLYDNLDRLIMTQDGNLRNDDLWLFTKYDIIGRAILTGLVTNTTQAETLQVNIDLFYADPNNRNHELKKEESTQYPHGYTNVAWPVYQEPADEILSVNYFDNYDFDKNDDYNYITEPEFAGIEPFDRVKGSLTGSKVRILDSSPAEWLYSVVYYDKKGRIIQSYAENHLDGYDMVNTIFDFEGKPVFSKHTHIINEGPAQERTDEYREFQYDHAGRDIGLMYWVDENEPIAMYEKKYNELGQLVEKNVHRNRDETYLQSIDYKYNIRGWLTDINNCNLYNENAAIDFCTELDPDEIVTGMHVDSIYMSVSLEDNSSGEGIITLAFSDVKHLIVSKIDYPDSTRILELKENELKELHEYTADTTTYAAIKSVENTDFGFCLNGMEFDEYDERIVIIDSITNCVLDHLANLGYTDSTTKAEVAGQVIDFMNARFGLVYFNEDYDDLFGMTLHYDDGLEDLNGTPLYNGNISGIEWQAAQNDGRRGYGIQYDEENRITKAEYGLIVNNEWDDEDRYGLTNVSYDKNGNITGLMRNGMVDYQQGYPPVFGVMDDLSYTYDGNQLQKVDDGAGDFTFTGNDFRDNGSRVATEYSYDDNGNMTEDKNKGISLIEYNILNLPKRIVYQTGYEISYLYTASGQKLTKIVNTGSTIETTNYAGNFVYDNSGAIEYFSMEEGRMTPVSGQPGQYQPEYFLTDHLGNVRVVYADIDDDGNPERLQENHYYPFGLTLGGLNYINNIENSLKYNGKELENDNNLRWYDYGFRRYDPQLGRWHVIDALSERHVNLSPYTYVSNNPFRFIDPFGLDFGDPDDGGGGGGGPINGPDIGRNIFKPAYYYDLSGVLHVRGMNGEIENITYQEHNGIVYRVVTYRDGTSAYIPVHGNNDEEELKKEEDEERPEGEPGSIWLEEVEKKAKRKKPQWEGNGQKTSSDDVSTIVMYENEQTVYDYFGAKVEVIYSGSVKKGDGPLYKVFINGMPQFDPHFSYDLGYPIIEVNQGSAGFNFPWDNGEFFFQISWNSFTYGFEYDEITGGTYGISYRVTPKPRDLQAILIFGLFFTPTAPVVPLIIP